MCHGPAALTPAICAVSVPVRDGVPTPSVTPWPDAVQFGVPAGLDHLLDDLNPPQRDAVLAGDGPLLVLAGAGSGKTRVIAHRIAHLLGVRGVHPRHVLAVTFTNKAAGEMARRVDALLAPAGIRDPLIATFHSACVRILRAHGEAIGVPRHFTIYDEDDRAALVKECMKEGELAERTFTPSAAAHRISYLKNQLVSVPDALRDARGPWEQKAALVYSRYEKRIREGGVVDFDDLLLLVVKLLGESPETLAWYRGLWKHVLVDEYQDTNRVQYRIIRSLTDEHRNVCVVGDSDQSIYKWRGADINNILDFEKDFPGTRVVKLEQNYRSTKSILALAAAVIDNNLQRKDKTLWTENPAGEPAARHPRQGGRRARGLRGDGGTPGEPARRAVAARLHRSRAAGLRLSQGARAGSLAGGRGSAREPGGARRRRRGLHPRRGREHGGGVPRQRGPHERRRRAQGGRGTGDPDDAALRQGPRVSRRLPHRPRGGRLPARALDERPRGDRGGAAPLLCRPHARARSALSLVCRAPAHPRLRRR